MSLWDQTKTDILLYGTISMWDQNKHRNFIAYETFKMGLNQNITFISMWNQTQQQAFHRMGIFQCGFRHKTGISLHATRSLSCLSAAQIPEGQRFRCWQERKRVNNKTREQQRNKNTKENNKTEKGSKNNMERTVKLTGGESSEKTTWQEDKN